jgi:GNAT superfamily N-acetyltransferase
MTPISISEVTTSRDLERLLALQTRLYADDAFWVPPLRVWIRRRLSARNPFFEDASLRLWLAFRGNEAVGSISALRDQKHEEVRGEKVAFFGFFETEDDPEVAGALLDVARGQARLWGCKMLRGPRNLSRVEETGLLVEGFDTSPPMLAGHHPPWYRTLIEAHGFVPHHDVLAYDIALFDEKGRPKPLPARLEEKAARVNIPGLEIRPASMLHLRRGLDLAHEVFVDAFRDVPENTPMSRRQFVNLGRAFLFFTDRRLLQLATVDGRAAGFALCFPELNEALRYVDGRLFPTGWLRFLRALPWIRTASFKLIGVLPEHRSSGLHALLIQHVVQGIRQAGFQRLEGSLIDERNLRMRRIVEQAGMEVYRRYRIYEQEVVT